MRIRHLLCGVGIVSSGPMITGDIYLPWGEAIDHLVFCLGYKQRLRIEVEGSVGKVIFAQEVSRGYEEIEFSSEDPDDMFRLVRLMTIFTTNLLSTPPEVGDMEKVFRIMSTNMGRKMGMMPSQLPRGRYQPAGWDVLRPIVVGLLNGELGFPD